jgi:hypothetical protein
VAEREQDPRDLVAEQCGQIADYLIRLEALTVHRPSPDGAPVRPSRPALIPEPYGAAGRAVMTTHEGLRRLEASLRLAVYGEPGRRRGGSDKNTDECRVMIVKLATQLTTRQAWRAARFLGWLINGAQIVPGIDEATRWRHLPREDGAVMPPQCPYCGGWYLLADVQAQIVVCSRPGCADGNGDPPVASYGVDRDGGAWLTWADGRRTAAPNLDPLGVAAHARD